MEQSEEQGLGVSLICLERLRRWSVPKFPIRIVNADYLLQDSLCLQNTTFHGNQEDFFYNLILEV